jgi:pimeloyl-ACP methyl ester carboxylesterase
MSEPDILATGIKADGTQFAQADSSPTEEQRGRAMHVLPSRTIPIVFIPGIMGSNLRLSDKRQAELKKKTNISWRPEAMMEDIALIFKSPAERQMIMDPEATEVDRYSLSDPKADERHDNVTKVPYLRDVLGPDGQPLTRKSAGKEIDQHARLRGWSEVFYESYGELLRSLEAQLNQMCKDGAAGKSWTTGERKAVDVSPKEWGGNGGEPLSADELKTISDAWYPVHAVGYNWLRSNGDSAKDVAARIREIIQYYKSRQFDCQKVIVVTHSMGGLVGRALVHPDYGNAQDVIAGIVHGAMPAVGAAAAYKRIRVGFEGDFLFKKVVGDDGPSVTAVLANSPGGLQLLPSERYGPGWLKAEVAGKQALNPPLPVADPYEEIYTVQDKWYRLINRDWMNPANLKETSWKSVQRNLLLAQEFHNKIGKCYHKFTYISYGADPAQAAWGEVTWCVDGAPNFSSGDSFPSEFEVSNINLNAFGWQLSKDNGASLSLKDGQSAQILSAKIASPIQLGDGTVPAERSAQDPERLGKAQIAYKQKGYDH